MHQRSFFDAEFEQDMAVKRMAATPPEKRCEQLGLPTNRPADVVVELNAACQAVLSVLADGRWHSTSEIITRSGYTEAMRRLRELRDYGYRIEKRGTGRSYEDRMAARAAATG